MRRNSWSRAAVFASALAIVAGFTQAVRADISNGDFSSPVLSALSYKDIVAGSSDLTNWTVLGTDVLLLHTTYYEAVIGVAFNAQGSSTQAVDLTGIDNTGLSNGVQQAVTTVPGQLYAVNFWVGTAISNNGATNYQNPASVDLQIDNGPRMTFVNPYETPGSVNWLQWSYQFVAANPSTLITFYNATPPSVSWYAGLDNVSLVAVPEPGSLTLCAVGLPLFLGMSWFRSRKSHR